MDPFLHILHKEYSHNTEVNIDKQGQKGWEHPAGKMEVPA